MANQHPHVERVSLSSTRHRAMGDFHSTPLARVERGLAASLKKSGEEIQAEARARADAQPLVTRCAVDSCDWHHDGTAGEGRELARTHRAEQHPELAVETQRVRHQRVAEARAQSVRAVSSTSTRRYKRWGEDSALEALRAFADREGHPPSQSDLRRNGDLPSGITIRNLFGSLGNAVVRLGYERPTHATRYERKAAA